MFRVIYFFVVLAVVTPFTASAQEGSAQARPTRTQDLVRVMPRRTPTPKEPIPEIRVRTEKFFKMIQEGKTAEAYDELLADERLGQQPANVQLLLQKTEQAMGLYGKMIRFEIFDNYTVGTGLKVVTYLTYHPVQPLRWRFVFYQPETAWHLIDVRADDVLEDLIDR